MEEQIIKTHEPAIETRGITVRFENNLANDAVSLAVNKNEIFALVGENGAGKTTLMNALYGLVTPESGEIYMNGKSVDIRSPKDAINHGLGMVHQHFMLVPSFTVAENIMLGQEPKRFGLFYDKREAVKRVEKLAESFGFTIDPNARVADLSVGMQQRVEILKTLSRGSDVLILDEPTAVLTPNETEELFSVLRRMVTERNKTVILITHKLYEVMQLSDRVGVMRKGRLIGVMPTESTNERELAAMMVGTRDSELRKIPNRMQSDSTLPPVIDIRNLKVHDERGLCAVDDVTLSVRPGEILGIAGVSGNGQTELSEAVTGLRPVTYGDVYINGVRINGMDAGAVRNLHTIHIPEDRQKTGLSVQASLTENVISGVHRDKRFSGLFKNIKRKDAALYADDIREKYDIRGAHPDSPVSELSGGNMQKVVIGREFSKDGTIAAVISQPTRGVDIGASEFIHSLIIEKRNSGIAILLISSDLDELMTLSDRIVTIYEGRITAEFDAKTAKKEDIGGAMLKSHKTEDAENV